MANVKNNAAAQDTQRRLLEAAGEVFAERGFHSATIKDITDRAGAALASVNYHFRDKAELYRAVLRRIQADAVSIIPPDDGLSGGENAPEAGERPRDARERLRAAIRHVVVRMLGRERPAWERVLMARELAQPSGALDPLIETVARPLHVRLSRLVAEVTGRRPDAEDVGLMTASIVGQCVYVLEHQPVIRRLHPELGTRLTAERLADHVAAFSLAAVVAQAAPRRAGTARAATRRPPRRAGAR